MSVRYRANPYVHLLQCFKCRDLDHVAKDCKSEISICGTCGDNHTTSECTSTHKRCSLCIKHEEYRNSTGTHGSGYGNCPFKTKQLKLESDLQWSQI